MSNATGPSFPIYREGMGGVPPVVWFDDFMGTENWTLGEPSNLNTYWVLEAAGGGVDTAAFVGDLPGGAVRLGTSTGTNAGVQMRTIPEDFIFTKGSRLSMQARARVTDISMRMMIGIGVTDLNAVTTTFDNGVAIGNDTDGVVRTISDAGGNEVYISHPGYSIVANRWHTFGIEWDGNITLGFYFDGQKVRQVQSASLIPTDLNLSVHLGVRQNASVAASIDIDYVGVTMDRP